MRTPLYLRTSSVTSGVLIDSDEDTDLEDLFPRKGYKIRSAQDVYDAACRKYNVIPSSHFMKQLSEEFALTQIRMNHKALDATELLPILTAILALGEVDTLDLMNNNFYDEGMDYIAKFLAENIPLKSLNVSNNQLESAGAKSIGKICRYNDCLSSLSAAGNGFHEKDVFHIVEALKTNYSLTYLDLSNNSFMEDGGVLLGQLIASNDSIQELNLSWNHLRLRGAASIAEGLHVGTRGLKLTAVKP